jgi:hypothetical protein
MLTVAKWTTARIRFPYELINSLYHMDWQVLLCIYFALEIETVRAPKRRQCTIKLQHPAALRILTCRMF